MSTIAEANADLTRMLSIWMDSWTNGPGTNPHFYETWKITPMIRPLKREVIGNVSDVLWVVMGTIGLVMLVACANVTNLLLVRIEARQQELAVRAALGAGWGRIVRGLLVESVMLGLMGGALGVALAYAGVRLLLAIGPANLPRLSEISLDARTLGFTVLLSVLSGLLLGLIPALKYAGPRASLALRSGGRAVSASRERHRARNLLVVAQVAMALVLLVSAGLMIRTFRGIANGRSGIHGCAAFAADAHLDSRCAGGRSGTSAANSERNSGEAGGNSGREVCGARKRNADGRFRFGLGLHLCPGQGLPRQRDGTAAAVQIYFSRVSCRRQGRD